MLRGQVRDQLAMKAGQTPGERGFMFDPAFRSRPEQNNAFVAQQQNPFF